MARATSTPTMRPTRAWSRNICRSRCVAASTIAPASAGSRPSWAAASPSGGAGGRSHDRKRSPWHRVCLRDRTEDRVMKRSLIALAILGLSAGAAVAAPGDPRVLQGTLEWPATVANEPFVVMRGEDGRLYYADISVAQRRTQDPLTSGSRMAVLGVEGSRPYEIAAIAVGA